jgi:hypothetical protein
MKKLYFLLALFAMFQPTPAFADNLVDSYAARLGRSDHFNSYGEHLRSPAAIIRQDRANFHVFGRIDPEDESDSFFVSKRNRATLESLVRNSPLSDDVLDEIVNGEPLVEITIWRRDSGRDYIEIKILKY